MNNLKVQAPGEAEAQCAVLVRAGKVFATATEDMDSLAFATPVLVRHLTMSEARFSSHFDSLSLLYLPSSMRFCSHFLQLL